MLMHRPALAAPAPSDPRPGVAWEECGCPLCGSDKSSMVLEAPDPIAEGGPGLWFAVVRCRQCRLTYTNPRPSADSIGQFYPADYRPHRLSKRGAGSRAPRHFWSLVFGRPCNPRRGTLPWNGTGRLLDFGCGGGGFLKRMADLGWQVTGVDSAANAVRRIRRDYEIPALLGSLPHPELSPASFDVVTMWHSLEHVHRPLAVLREARRLLIPGGRLIVAVPNLESLPYHLFGRSWFGLDLPRHLTHFTPRTLTAMLEAAGFRVEPVRTVRHSDWLRSSAKQALRDGRGGWVARLLRSKPLSKLAAWGCYVAGLSDCMMVVAERPE